MIISNLYAGRQLQFNTSLNRPAWLQEDWEAYNHKFFQGKIKIDYYKKRRQNAKTN